MSDWKPTLGRDALTRDGRRVTEIERRNTVSPYVISGRIGITYYTWMEDGHHSAVKVRHPLDLVADADPLPATSPVRERTVREIVPGPYWRLSVYYLHGELRLSWLDDQGVQKREVPLTAPELRDAARVLTELADAMEAGE